MIEKFEENKLYKFSYEYFKNTYTGELPISIHDRWAKKYDGKLISKILSKEEAEIIDNGIRLSIQPNWCDEFIDVEYFTVDKQVIKEGMKIKHTYKNGTPHLKGIVKRNVRGYLRVVPFEQWNRYENKWEESNDLVGKNHYLKPGNNYEIIKD